MFVCKYCGCKYSVEEAKKMMVEVDNTKKLANLYERARKSLEVDDLENAAEYYKQILDEKPNDWEAYFYSYLGEFTSFTNNQAASVVVKLSKTIPAAYDMAIEDCSVKEAIERIKTITSKTSDRLVGISATGEALLRQYEGGNVLTPTGKVNNNLFTSLYPIAGGTIAKCVVAYDPIEAKIQDIINADNGITLEAIKDVLLQMRKARYAIADMTFLPMAGITDHVIKPELIYSYAEKVHELDETFAVPSVKSKTNKTNGCYVATAVYGSYDCPEVWTLRRYRDYDLAEIWYGRAFVHIYYAISPILVKWFGHTDWFKKMWRGKLDCMVKKLQDKGYESTPYEDLNW